MHAILFSLHWVCSIHVKGNLSKTVKISLSTCRSNEKFQACQELSLIRKSEHRRLERLGKNFAGAIPVDYEERLGFISAFILISTFPPYFKNFIPTSVSVFSFRFHHDQVSAFYAKPVFWWIWHIIFGYVFMYWNCGICVSCFDDVISGSLCPDNI